MWHCSGGYVRWSLDRRPSLSNHQYHVVVRVANDFATNCGPLSVKKFRQTGRHDPVVQEGLRALPLLYPVNGDHPGEPIAPIRDVKEVLLVLFSGREQLQ